jgi:nucleoside 2-deoxyribosyltransferase
MNIYFAGSIRGGRQDAALYASIIDYLRRFGSVLTEHVGSPGLMPSGEENLSDSQIHRRDLQWLRQSDIVIAEVTTPSLGVGYEIGRAVESEKPVLCLFRNNRGKRLSAMIGGCEALNVIQYESLQDLQVELERFLRTFCNL